VTSVDWAALNAAALQAAAHAYAPYSHLHVGAAGLTDSGTIVTGCNVENASFGLTLCAECGLVTDLHRHGGGHLVAIAVVDGDGSPLTPCGRCRQLLYEAGGASLIVNETDTVGDLLPGAFGPENLPT
jgi:cytidine deaminase